MTPERHLLHSERLRLEPTTVAHAEVAWKQLIDPKLWRFFPELRPQTLAQVRALYARWERGNPDATSSERWENWVCFLKGTHVPVGSAQATILGEGSALIAYMMYVQWQGYGYAREAAASVIDHLRDVHGIRRVLADMNTSNIASIRVVESLGFLRLEQRVSADSRFPGSEFVYALEC